MNNQYTNAIAWITGLQYPLVDLDYVVKNIDPIKQLKQGIEYTKLSQDKPAVVNLDTSLDNLRERLKKNPNHKNLALLIDTCLGYLIGISGHMSPPQSIIYMKERDAHRKEYGMQNNGIIERRRTLQYLNTLNSVDDVLR